MPQPITPPLRYHGFERLIDRLRDHQLEAIDDPDERASLQANVAEGRATAFGYLLLAMLHARAGRFGEAEDTLRVTPADPRWDAVVQVLRGCFLVRAGRALEGWEFLKPPADDPLAFVPSSEEYSAHTLVAARAFALWEAGDRDRAYALATAASQMPEATDYRWNELAQYAAALGRWGEVVAAIEKVEPHNRSGEANYALALARRVEGNDVAAVAALTAAVEQEPSLRAFAKQDPRWLELAPEVVDPPPADLSWLKKLKPIAPLLESAALRELGVEWIDAATSKQETTSACGPYKGRKYTMGLIWPVVWWDRCSEVAKGKVALARLPEVHKRSLMAVHGLIFYDKKQPGSLWFTPNPSLPAGLWIRVDANERALVEALQWFYPVKRIPRLELTRKVRAWAGNMAQLAVPSPYTGELETAGVAEIERMWVSSPSIDMLNWGSQYEDDPWPNQVRAGGFTLSFTMREHAKQRPGSLPTFTYRTHFSRSQLTLEVHPDGNYVFDIRYRPSPFSEPVRDLNERFSMGFPEDLPIDVVSACIGFQFITWDWLLERMEDPEWQDRLASVITIAASVGYDDLQSAELLRKYAKHSDLDVAASALNAMIRYNYVSYLAEAGSLPLPEDYLSAMANCVEDGMRAPFAELYPGDPGDDDEEDEE